MLARRALPRRRTGALTLALALLATQPAGADGLDAAVREFNRGNHAVAIPAFERAAGAGSGEAAMFLAFAYQRGLGVDADRKRSIEWYRIAAERGNPHAQAELAALTEAGIGMPADFSEAEYWYSRAIAQGYCPGELKPGGRLLLP
ncbi:MAG: sel1 repeat family protein [Chromatiales bacterium]|nr:sel1 repeat family protein [Chromatiales bacterium]